MDWRCNCLHCKAIDVANNYTITHLQGNIFRILPFYQPNPNPEDNIDSHHNVHETQDSSGAATDQRPNSVAHNRGDRAPWSEHTFNSTQGIRGPGSSQEQSESSSVLADLRVDASELGNLYPTPGSPLDFWATGQSPSQMTNRELDDRLKNVEIKLRDIVSAVREFRRQAEHSRVPTPMRRSSTRSESQNGRLDDGLPQKIIVKKCGTKTLVYQLIHED